MDIFTLIRTKYNTLSQTQKKIADWILEHGNEIILMSIGEIAAKCSTSEATVMRFLRKLGFDSYQLFKVKVAQDIVDVTPRAVYEDVSSEDSVNEIKQKVIQSTIDAIRDIDKLIEDSTIEKAIEIMANAKRIFFFGVGASGAIAKDAFHKFLRLGINTIYCSDSHIMSIMCSHMTEKDAVLAISHSGESREIIDAIELAKENKAKVISFTSYPNSTLAKLSDVVFLSATKETKFRSDAMVSRIVQCVIIDILYVSLVLKLGSEAIVNVNKSRLAVAKKKK